MKLETLRFGQIEIDEAKILVFNEGIPGLEEYKKYALLKFEDSYPIVWLQSVEDSAVCLPVIDSFVVLPDYAFDISDEDVDELELDSTEELHVLSVLVIPEKMSGMTVNLAAPILINTRTNSAKQIILGGGEYNVRFPVFQHVVKIIREGIEFTGGEVEADAGAVTEDK